MKCTITCTGFRPCRRNTLAGFATIRIGELRLTIRDIAIHEKGASRWAQLPNRPVLQDGMAVYRDGRQQYVPIMEFDSREVREAFSAAVINAVLAAVPHVFDDEEAAA